MNQVLILLALTMHTSFIAQSESYATQPAVQNKVRKKEQPPGMLRRTLAMLWHHKIKSAFTLFVSIGGAWGLVRHHMTNIPGEDRDPGRRARIGSGPIPPSSSLGHGGAAPNHSPHDAKDSIQPSTPPAAIAPERTLNRAEAQVVNLHQQRDAGGLPSLGNLGTAPNDNSLDAEGSNRAKSFQPTIHYNCP